MKYSLIFLAVVLVVSIEARKNCERQAKKAKRAGENPPQCNGKDFLPEQCDGNVCFCAKAKNGKNLYGDFKFAASENYDCSKEPSECQIKRNGILVSGQKISPPKCDADGEYMKECKMVPDNNNIGRNKPTMQSSQGWGGLPSRGVDGNRNPQWGGATCTHTQSTQAAWWAVDLGEGAQVSKVAITNRADCCSDRLANFQVGLTDTDPRSSAPTLSSYSPCAVVPGQLGAGETRSLTCHGKGRFLVVQLRGRNYLTLCEVEVFGAREVCE